MTTLKINFRNLVRRRLPEHKRLPNRIKLLSAFIAPLEWLFAAFDKWRSDTRMIVNVTSQVAVFEGYLRAKYNEPIAIKVVTYDDLLLPVCFASEGVASMPPIGGENEATAGVPFSGEIRERFGDADFIVYIPDGSDLAAITAEIERFKQALTRYKIIQQ